MSKVFAGSIYLILSFPIAAPVIAMSCVEFNSIGAARTAEEFTSTEPTEAQITPFKEIIAYHAGRIAAFGFFSKRKQVLNLAKRNGKLVWFVANSLSMTRIDCLRQPEKRMDDLAIENFNFLIDAAAEKL